MARTIPKKGGMGRASKARPAYVVQVNLFQGGEIKPKRSRKKKGDKTIYYWVTTRLLRESGPWYAPQVMSPGAVAQLVNEHLDLKNADREYMVGIYLDRKNCVNAVQVVSIGTLDSAQIHPREVFKTALLTSSAGVVLVHNHPSGDPRPSRDDLDITRRLVDAGKLLGIELVDHVIIGTDA